MQGDQPGLRELIARAARVAVALLLFGLGAAAAETTVALREQTVRDKVLLRRASYNYAPAIIRDGSTYHAYWCSGGGGDVILHLQAPSLDGPWRSSSFWSRFDVALRPTGSPTGFDGLHTCDLNVMKLGDTFYLYYTGGPVNGTHGAIGVATSKDGIHFDRANGGRPIATAALTNPNYAAQGLTYGAGQPAVVYIAPYVYLSFTDNTGAGGDGQFALRSSDPTFAGDVQELTAGGWRPREPGRRTGEYQYLDSYGLDLAYDPPTGMLLAATDRDDGKTTILFIDPRTFKTVARGDLPLAWREGPSLVTAADKTTLPRPRCEEMDIAVAAGEGASSEPITWTSLAYSAGTFALADLCAHAGR